MLLIGGFLHIQNMSDSILTVVQMYMLPQHWTEMYKFFQDSMFSNHRQGVHCNPPAEYLLVIELIVIRLLLFFFCFKIIYFYFL